MGFARSITDADFKSEVIESKVPVLVDFWASWCGPCQMMAPIIDKLAEEYEGRVKVLKLNVDENPQTPQLYGVRAIPTFILFSGGQAIDRLVGAQPKSALEDLIRRVLNP